MLENSPLIEKQLLLLFLKKHTYKRRAFSDTVVRRSPAGTPPISPVKK